MTEAETFIKTGRRVILREAEALDVPVGHAQHMPGSDREHDDSAAHHGEHDQDAAVQAPRVEQPPASLGHS